MIKYSAPGKVILSGEHSVVYGKPALVTALELSLTVTIEEGTRNHIDTLTNRALDHCDKVVQKYLDKKNISFNKRNWRITIDSDIPPGRGLGSSAAFCVAAVASMLHFYTNQEFKKNIVNNLAFQCEKYFHGMPSGVDVSASTFGGLIYYRKEFEFLKNISSLNFKIPQKFQEKLVLIDSGKPSESTSDMIKLVGKRYNAQPIEMEQTLNKIERITKRMVVSIVKEDEVLFRSCISENQQLLERLGIVSESTKNLLNALKPYGVGKVTGAGGIKKGSGMILFYCDNGIKDIDYIDFTQNFDGVNIFKERNG